MLLKPAKLHYSNTPTLRYSVELGAEGAFREKTFSKVTFGRNWSELLINESFRLGGHDCRRENCFEVTVGDRKSELPNRLPIVHRHTSIVNPRGGRSQNYPQR